ncbi:MAG: tetratricopeptide repeat protein [Patescibacteria group bacterium]
MKISAKNKLLPGAKGDLLEDATYSLIKLLSDELGFGILELRRQGKGTQFGKDLKWRFLVTSATEPHTKTEYTWFFEDKNHEDKDLGTKELAPKIVEVHKYTTNQILDVCCFLLPHVSVKNEMEEIISDEGLYPFKISCWSPDQEIENLVMCYPDLYERIYGERKEHASAKRQKYIELWKHTILATSTSGYNLRQAKRNPTQNIADSNAQIIDASINLSTESKSKGILKETANSNSMSMNIIADNVTKDKIGLEIKKALEMIDKGKEDEALEVLFTILGELKGKSTQLTNELARTYNNIGVAYFQKKEDQKAIEYYHKALEVDPNFTISITNIVATKLLIADSIKDLAEKEKLLSEIKELIQPLWSSSEHAVNENVMHAYLKTIVAINGISNVENLFLDTLSEDQKTTLNTSLKLNYLLASLYLNAWEFEKSKIYIDKTLELDDDIEVLILQGRYYMLISLKLDTLNPDMSYEDLTPTFTTYENLDIALKIFNDALVAALEKGNIEQISYIKSLMSLAKLWRKDDEAHLEVDSEYTPKIQNNYMEAVTAFREKKYDHSLALMKKSGEWNTLPPQEIFRLSRAYFFNGATEIARELQTSIEGTDLAKDFRYWIDRSLVEVLLGNKNTAMQFSTTAKELAVNENDKKIALSHRGALYLRYAGEDGGDRVLQNAFEYENAFPEAEILQKFNFEEEKDKILGMINERRAWAIDIQNKYENNPIPSYF